MSVTNGLSYMTFEHPMDGNIYEIEVSWRYVYSPAVMYLSNGDPGYPDETDLTWTAELISIDDVLVTPGTPVPDWITEDMICEEIDLDNCYDGDDN
jgi:hypothetical protein